MLDESVVMPFAKADQSLVSESRARADRRDPLWRQKHFRREGVHYYSSVSLFRAGEDGLIEKA